MSNLPTRVRIEGMYPVDDVTNPDKFRFGVREFEIKNLLVLHMKEDRYMWKRGVMRGVMQVRTDKTPHYGPFYMRADNAEKLRALVDKVRLNIGEETVDL